MTFELNTHVARLLNKEPFFAALSRHIEKKPSNNIGTAGVRIHPDSGHFEMIYNPIFFAKLTDSEVGLVLIHEFYHLILEHVFKRLPVEGMTKRWNYATDMAINGEIFPFNPTSNIKNLFEMAILSEKFKLPRGKSAEWYFEAIEGKMSESEGEKGANGRENGSAGQGFDDHSEWAQKSSEELKELARQRLHEACKEGAQEAMANGWGTVSGDMRKEIMDNLNGKIDWRKVLRYFIKTSVRSSKQSSIKKINRRFPYIHSGRKINRTAKIVVAIDQSGSVSDNMLALFYAELNKVADIAEFTVVPFDSMVDDELVYIWKRGETRKSERVKHGGTCFDAPTRWVNDRNYDGLIILTDMEAPRPMACKAQRLWVTNAHGLSNSFATNERIISID